MRLGEGNPRARSRRLDRPRRRRARPAVQPAAPFEVALVGRRRGVDLARHRVARRRSSRSAGASSHRPRSATATDDRGDARRYDRLLLATGGRPRRLPFGGDGVVHFRTVADYRRTRESPTRARGSPSSAAGSSARRSPRRSPRPGARWRWSFLRRRSAAGCFPPESPRSSPATTARAASCDRRREQDDWYQ